MEMPVNVTERLRELAKKQIGESVFFPDSGMAKNPQNSIIPIANRLGGPRWVRSRRTEGGYTVWKKLEPRNF